MRRFYKIVFLFVFIHSGVLTAKTHKLGVTTAGVSDTEIPKSEIPNEEAATASASPPIVNVDFTFTNTNGCSKIKFTSTVTEISKNSYLWHFGDGVTSTYSNPEHEYKSIGCGSKRFNVSLTILNSSKEFVKKITKTVTVKQQPNVEFYDLKDSTGKNAFRNCGSSGTDYEVIVGKKPTSGGCIDSFSIDWGDGEIQTENIKFPIKHTYTSKNVFQMIIYTKGKNGCVKSKEFTVKNTANPMGGIIGFGSTQNLCAPTANLEFEIPNWGANSIDTKYTVDYGDGTIETLSQKKLEGSVSYNKTDPAESSRYPIRHVYQKSNCPKSTYNIKLTISNACGISPYSLQNITVLTTVNASFTSPDAVCVGNVVRFKNTTTPKTPKCTLYNYNYEWDYGSPTATSRIDQNTYASEGTQKYSKEGEYTVRLTATDACGGTTAEQKINVHPLPTISGALSVCTGFTSQLIGTGAPSGKSPWRSSNTAVATVDSKGLVTGLKPGNTTITYTNFANCTVTALFTVKSIPGMKQPASASICLGGVLKDLVVGVSEKSAGISYQWYANTVGNTTSGTEIAGAKKSTYSPPATTLGTNYYYCVVSGTCVELVSNPAKITVNPKPTIKDQPTPSQSLCVGEKIEKPLTLSLSGGAGTPTYRWYKNGTLIDRATAASYTPPASNVVGDFDYYATVSLSGSGCGLVSTAIAKVKFVNPPTISLNPLGPQTVCLNATPTNLSATAAGGFGVFTYQWYRNSTDSNTTGTAISGETTTQFTPTTAAVGTTYYYCVATQKGGGCSVASPTKLIAINPVPTIASQPASSTICLGGTAELSVAINGAFGTPSYQWYANTVENTTSGTEIAGATTATYSPPAATTLGTNYYYCVIRLPFGGCSELTSNAATITINQNPVISASAQFICSGNTFVVSPENSGSEIVPLGTTYSWASPTINPLNSITGASAEKAQTQISQSLINTTTTNSATATYTVTPLSGSCTGVPFTIEIAVNPAISLNAISKNSTCFVANNEAVQNAVTGGTPFDSTEPYLVSWTGPNGFLSKISAISNLSPGNYTLAVTDAKNCTVTETYPITERTDIVISTDLEKNVSCFNASNGEIKITVEGGSLPYIYAWTKNGTAYANTEDLSNLSPGTYELTLMDANKCGPKKALFTITQPPVLNLNLKNQTNIVCYGQAEGAITVAVSGGTLPYSYTWTGPNGFASSSQNLSALFAGTYNLTLTDKMGCVKKLRAVITQNPEINIIATTTPIRCYGDNNASIRLAVSGGVAPYSILWSNLGGGTYQDNLAAGDYLVTVTDALNCTKKLTVPVAEVPVVTMQAVVKNVSCFGKQNGSISLNITGGVAPIKLVWSDSAVARNGRNNLGPGSYTATITDGKDCVVSRTFTILEPQSMVLSANITNAFDCNNPNSGTINLIVSGGSAPFTYTWSNGATTKEITAVPAGSYLVTVKDTNGCAKQAQYPIDRHPPIVTKVATKTDFDCEDRSLKQTFVAEVSGGVPPYQLAWSSGLVSGDTNEFMNTSQNGLVMLYATDHLGCKSMYSFTVDIPTLGKPSFNTRSYAYSIYGKHSVQDPIQFANAASGDYISIAWDFGDGSLSTELNPVHVFVKEGHYTVTQTVSYPFGCVSKKTKVLKIGKGYELISPDAFTPTGDGFNDNFKPILKGLKSLELSIYTSWGELIYSEKGEVLRGWDGRIKGKESENGNYYFKMSGTTFYGTTVTVSRPFVLIK